MGRSGTKAVPGFHPTSMSSPPDNPLAEMLEDLLGELLGGFEEIARSPDFVLRADPVPGRRRAAMVRLVDHTGNGLGEVEILGVLAGGGRLSPRLRQECGDVARVQIAAWGFRNGPHRIAWQPPPVDDPAPAEVVPFRPRAPG